MKKAWRSAGLHSHSFLTEICVNTRHLLSVLLQPAESWVGASSLGQVRAVPPPPQTCLSALPSFILPSFHLSSAASQLSGLWCKLFTLEMLKTQKRAVVICQNNRFPLEMYQRFTFSPEGKWCRRLAWQEKS